MVSGFYLRYLDVTNKLDDMKTVIDLVMNVSNNEVILSSVHTFDDDVEVCKIKRLYYTELLLNKIREQIKKDIIIEKVNYKGE